MRKTQKLVFISLLVAQALVLYIIERSIPVPFITPGAKLGLSNIITVISLYILPLKDASLVIILRIILSTAFGGTFSSFLYSLAGGFLSLFAMYITKITLKEEVSIIGISLVGAFFHNVGQIFVAALVINNIKIVVYLPVLTLAALGTGFFVGITSRYLLSYLRTLPVYKNLNNNTIKGD